MPTSRYLTKSKFKLGMECPTKLYYTGKTEYADRTLEDSFLSALADGGFQVGALAKCYFPGGIQVLATDYDGAISQTNELLSRDGVTIYEAAFRHELFFVRADIVIKNGQELDLIEVKAKSCDFADEASFIGKGNKIKSDFKKHIEDVAFQKFVIQRAYPGLKVKAFLMLADKTTVCPTDGLNQKFRLIKDGQGRKAIDISANVLPEDLDPRVLRMINVDTCCEIVYSEIYDDSLTFEQMVTKLADSHSRDEKILTSISKDCKTCEFRLIGDETNPELKSGFRECWTEALGWQEADFDEPTVLDIWNYSKKNDLIAANKIKLSSLSIEDIGPAAGKSSGLSTSQRQWLQIEKAQNRDNSVWIDVENLKREMDSWKFPLHFIDFETSMPVIPFKKGRRPYEGIAFQFSHHIVAEDGNVEHRGQFLQATPGTFPNYDFVRELKEQLEGDSGSIFRYHNHENSYLVTVCDQLQRDESDIAHREELCAFIKTITRSTQKSAEQWEGERNMIDLYQMVIRHYYAPETNGSNSIKYILPAVLNNSTFLKEKYARPIYGAAEGIPSFNFMDHSWVEYDNGRVRDPYKLLPRLFADESDHDYEVLISEMDELRDGGAALTAYGKLQFQEMGDYERKEIESALLKYCELDTLAMVMIYEAWRAAV